MVKDGSDTKGSVWSGDPDDFEKFEDKVAAYFYEKGNGGEITMAI